MRWSGLALQLAGICSGKQTRAVEEEERARGATEKETQKLIEETVAGGLYLEITGVFWLAVGLTLATASVEIVRWFGLSLRFIAAFLA